MALTTKTNLSDMSIGDMIPCRYTTSSGVACLVNLEHLPLPIYH